VSEGGAALVPDREQVPPADPTAGPSRSSRWRRWGAILLPLLVLAYILSLVRLPYFVVTPGPARDVEPLIHIDERTVYSSKGHFLLTSVRFRQANVYDVVASWVDPFKSLLPERALIAPGETPEEEAQVAQSQMDTSKIDATVVALANYTDYPEEHGPGALIEQAFAGTPAEGKLFAGDVITSIDGHAIQGPDQAGQRITAAGEGTTLTFTVRPLGETKSRRVRLAPALIAGQDRAVIGVSLVENFPFPIDIESGDIGGPSAGLMWTLGVIDLLTPGDMTSGRTIAGTGTIDVSGDVGEIGGVEDKVVAAERAGAVVFFVPTGNAAAARSVAGSISIVAVETYLDAVRYLQAQG
jgi:Lon-like protease